MASRNLLDQPVGSTLIRSAFQMSWGMAAVMLFNIVDTFFVGRLGTAELAAMSFTFPVTYVFSALMMGVGLGVSATISRAIGKGDRHQVRRLATDSLFLAFVLGIVFVVVGLATLDQVFRRLGAEGEILALVPEYMVPYYLGVLFLVVPMVGNSAIRATGDMKTPSLIMIVAGGVNMALDPVLIFGLGPFPKLGLRGAAIASVIAWMLTFAASLWILARRERMLDLDRMPRVAEVWDSWKRILHIAVPGGISSLMAPLSSAVLTRMVADFGPVAVAAYGVATRFEALSLIGVYALAVSVTPFMGQSFGAARWDRVREGLRFTSRAVLAWGLGVGALLLVLGRPLVGLFTKDPAVIDLATRYLRYVPWSYGALGAAMVAASVFSALNRPSRTALLSALRLLVLAVPLAWMGGRLFGVPGIFVGIASANLVAGVVGYGMVLHHVEREQAREVSE